MYPKIEEPAVTYESSKHKSNGIDRADFDAEFEKGYTTEEAKAESIRRIREMVGEIKVINSLVF